MTQFMCIMCKSRTHNKKKKLNTKNEFINIYVYMHVEWLACFSLTFFI